MNLYNRRGRSSFRAAWGLFLIASLAAVLGVVLALLEAPYYLILVLCPVAWAFTFGGLLLSSRVARRIREEAKHE